jgi:hypothetical protein
MTLGTACRGILIAGLIFCFVAINAQFIHDFFLLKLPDILKLADCTRFLGEHGMAGIAVFESVLMGMVGKRNIPTRAGVYAYLFSAFVFDRHGDGCNQDSSGKKYNKQSNLHDAVPFF